MPRQRRRLRVTGVVQGVGFRPFVHRLARELALTGHVGNDGRGVFAEVEGPAAALDDFERRLRSEAPPLAVVESVRGRDVPATGTTDFVVVASVDDYSDGSTVALVPPDTACCADCLRETLDPADRRFRYPFTACTFCGPRFTMVTGLPYDRPNTTMAAFPLCGPCGREYDDPADRRFHAQPTACPTCGPRLQFGRAGHPDDGVTSDSALAAALRVIRDGGVVAVKGVGGYHLACDATRPAVVDRLRARKQRSSKPLAVIVPDVAVARRVAMVGQRAEALLTDPAGPIVVLPVADNRWARELAGSVAPGNGSLGVMLPYTPLHHLLFQPHPLLATEGDWRPEVLVLTSANLADEPICTDPAEAERRLSQVADAFLHHNRPIHVACDDSVIRLVDGDLQPVRRSRGYTPLPVRLPFESPPALAVGGELKATACVAQGRRAWLSQHLGDVSSLETVTSLRAAASVLASLSRVRPEVVVADLHPGYLSRRWAVEYATELGAGWVLVQHHHAHLASLLAEHAVHPNDDVLGFVFDGTGFGTDGTIWGGEVLLGSYRQADRVGHLAPVALPGGDAAIRRPPRVALAHLAAAGVGWDPDLPCTVATDEVERRVVDRMLSSGSGCVPTTSMGRLFDAVASIAGVCHEADYEGQAAIELEAVSEGAAKPAGSSALAFDVTEDLVLDPGPLLVRCVARVLSGTSPAVVGLAFHEAVARAVTEVASRVRDRTGVGAVGLTGGVFQNALLTRLARARLEQAQFTVLVHRTVPPNDAGLALGQVAVAALGGGEERS